MKAHRLLWVSWFAVSLVGAAERAEDFGYASMVMFTPGDALYAFALPEAVYRHAVAADLGDVRMFNAAGDVVAHALRAPAPQTPVAAAPLPIFPVRGSVPGESPIDDLTVEVHRDGTVISVRGSKPAGGAPIVAWLVDASHFESAIDSIDLDIAGDGDVVARVTVEASDDLKHWTRIAEDAPVLRARFAGERLDQLRIALGGTQARYLRLVDTRGAFPFTLAGVRASAVASGDTRILETVILAPGATDATARAWEFDTGGHFPVERVGLIVTEDNAVVPFELSGRVDANQPWRSIGNGVAYRFTQNGLTVTSKAVPIARTTDRFLRVRMNAGSGAWPTVAPKLVLHWQPAELVFAARGEPPFTLAYGRSNVASVALPIATLIPGYGTDKALEPGPAQVSAEYTLAGARAIDVAPDYRRWALWAVLAVGVSVLGAMGLKLAREASDSRVPPTR